MSTHLTHLRFVTTEEERKQKEEQRRQMEAERRRQEEERRRVEAERRAEMQKRQVRLTRTRVRASVSLCTRVCEAVYMRVRKYGAARVSG